MLNLYQICLLQLKCSNNSKSWCSMHLCKDSLNQANKYSLKERGFPAIKHWVFRISTHLISNNGLETILKQWLLFSLVTVSIQWILIQIKKCLRFLSNKGRQCLLGYQRMNQPCYIIIIHLIRELWEKWMKIKNTMMWEILRQTKVKQDLKKKTF